MTRELLGLPLNEATRRLDAAGARYTLTETSSRKGSGGDDARVVRVRRGADGVYELVWALFVRLDGNRNE